MLPLAHKRTLSPRHPALPFSPPLTPNQPVPPRSYKKELNPTSPSSTTSPSTSKRPRLRRYSTTSQIATGFCIPSLLSHRFVLTCPASPSPGPHAPPPPRASGRTADGRHKADRYTQHHSDAAQSASIASTREPSHRRLKKPKTGPQDKLIMAVSCPHQWQLVKSDSTLIQWVCHHCRSGPHWMIFECTFCKLHLCRACTQSA